MLGSFDSHLGLPSQQSRNQESDKRICWEWNVQRERGTRCSPFEIMYGSPIITRALNRARGVHTVRAPTAEERAELEQCGGDDHWHRGSEGKHRSAVKDN